MRPFYICLFLQNLASVYFLKRTEIFQTCDFKNEENNKAEQFYNLNELIDKDDILEEYKNIVRGRNYFLNNVNLVF
uniref:Uncharacterized protein n=1 Tax=viral metagenome TaxID=1070528 RepID=A0A6C0BD32_9ZZZZ